MSKPDLAVDHGLVAFRQPLEHLPDRDCIRGCARIHVAVEAHPVDRADRAVFIPGVRCSEFSRLAGEGDLLQIDHTTALNQALPTQVVEGWRVDVLRREHKKRLPNTCSLVNGFEAETKKNRAVFTDDSFRRPAPPRHPLPSPSYRVPRLPDAPRNYTDKTEMGRLDLPDRYNVGADLLERNLEAGREN